MLPVGGVGTPRVGGTRCFDIVAGAVGEFFKMIGQALDLAGCSRQGRGGRLGFRWRRFRPTAHIHDDVNDVGQVVGDQVIALGRSSRPGLVVIRRRFL